LRIFISPRSCVIDCKIIWLAKYAISNICENYHNGYHYSYDYLVHHLVLSFLSSMSCLFYSWTLCHFVCFLFLLNAWAFVVEFVLVFMSWGKDCADVQVYRTITLFSFLSFVSEKKKKRELYLAFISTHACPLLSFILFIKSLLKKAWKQVLKLLDFWNSKCTNFLMGFSWFSRAKMSFFCKFSQQKKKERKNMWLFCYFNHTFNFNIGRSSP